ncbi:thiamine binding protein [Aliarcobacter faecis]|uniref:MTH1187 family thiamine-binding protein n=1 Tax=Aliarcobacter faecis TaxID=1564138 RepID=UPI000479DA01|nr:MTH1187 family thiamine-binding protein [Aliarcobacter faecis]QKF73869.1 thiamine binding protein [Aliarcobacter faecis]
MSVLMSLSMFPTNTVGSKSKEVSEILKIIKDSGLKYQLTSMNTIVEAKTLKELLDLVNLCYLKLEELGCSRVYASINFDIRTTGEDRINSKIKSVENHIGIVSK